MKFNPASGAGLGALSLLGLASSAIAHSWIEKALRIDPNTRKFVGKPGYPRGGDVRRLIEDNAVNDESAIHRLPAEGIYTGDENINKDGLSVKTLPEETLKAAPGDFIAILHMENGHVTTKEPDRPLNGGNIYLYGTSEPQDAEKLFDVHLAWNTEGTGGNGRGRLLGARNYDDLHCYEAASSELGQSRMHEEGNNGADKVACQADIQLPQDLQPGDSYTIYWYWDWPRLNPEAIDMEGTKEGLFPWMGTFMRGGKDPRGFTIDALQTNESYASTIDIEIVKPGDFSMKLATSDGESSDPAAQGMAIKEQLEDKNFALPVEPNQGGGGGGGGGGGDAKEPTIPDPKPSSPSDSIASPFPPSADKTVTVTETIPAKTVVETVTVTAPAPSPTDGEDDGGMETVIEVVTEYSTVWQNEPTPPSTQEDIAEIVTKPTTTAKTLTTPVAPGAAAVQTGYANWKREEPFRPRKSFQQRRANWGLAEER